MSDAITYGGWTAVVDEEGDGDGFWVLRWWAERDGERKLLNHSRFRFKMTPERFAYLVDNDFPSCPPECAQLGRHYPWGNEDIDKALSEAEENQS